MKKGLLVVAALAVLWIGFKSARQAGFDNGWDAGRCYDWESMNRTTKARLAARMADRARNARSAMAGRV